MTAPEPEESRYEPPPSVGKLLVWVLLFMVAALAVVLGGVYLTWDLTRAARSGADHRRDGGR